MIDLTKILDISTKAGNVLNVALLNYDMKYPKTDTTGGTFTKVTDV